LAFGDWHFLNHMENLTEQINADVKVAMIAKNELSLLTLRMLTAALKNRRIEMGKEAVLTDEDVVAVIQTEIKKRKDSAESYLAGNRADLADKEKAEIVILSKYMPEQMSAEELEKITQETIAQLDASGMKDFGKVMGVVMGKVKGRADGGQVNEAVKKLLA